MNIEHTQRFDVISDEGTQMSPVSFLLRHISSILPLPRACCSLPVFRITLHPVSDHLRGITENCRSNLRAYKARRWKKGLLVTCCKVMGQ